MDHSAKLRKEIRERAERFANTVGASHYLSRGDPGVVLFEPTSGAISHGNFCRSSYAAITENPQWNSRLQKPHSQQKSLPDDKAMSARELDSSNSSDALLMNCFCFPGGAKILLAALGVQTRGAAPEFGFKARIPLADETQDATEIDMRVGDNLFEAKLCEKDFTSRLTDHVKRYRDLDKVFDVRALPLVQGQFTGYQLIRNVLAAAHHQASLFVLIDERRPDLLQEWWRIHSAIRDTDLRLRCGFRTWQEIAGVSPPELRTFLGEKYGL